MSQDFQRWIKDGGDTILRVTYDLNDESIILDLGGYDGKWADFLHKKYGSFVYIFEPVNQFFNVLVDRFKDNDKVKIHKYGVSNETKKMEISLTNDASSLYGDKINVEVIDLKNINEILEELNLSKIDLFKINIEGEEYNVLESILENGNHLKMENLQIQFHNNVDNFNERRNLIRDSLSKTHELTYDYAFIWENWKKK
jgi:FkbM family methyltransferase